MKLLAFIFEQPSYTGVSSKARDLNFGLSLCLHPYVVHAQILRGGGQGDRTPPPPPINKKNGFLSNSGPDPLKNHRHASETPFLNGVSLMGR